MLELAPDHVKFLACALHWAPEKWRNEAWIRQHMALSAHKEAHVQTIVQMIRANDFFIQQHLDGTMEREARVQAPLRIRQAYLDEDDEFPLAGDQLRVADNVNKRVDQALAVRYAASEEEADRLLHLADEHGSMALWWPCWARLARARRLFWTSAFEELSGSAPESCLPCPLGCNGPA